MSRRSASVYASLNAICGPQKPRRIGDPQLAPYSTSAHRDAFALARQYDGERIRD